MKGYWVCIYEKIDNNEKLKEYASKAKPAVESFSGKFLVRGGGVGKCIAEWIIDGEPSIDVWAMDVARFGDYASPHYGTIKSSENYERESKLVIYPFQNPIFLVLSKNIVE